MCIIKNVKSLGQGRRKFNYLINYYCRDYDYDYDFYYDYDYDYDYYRDYDYDYDYDCKSLEFCRY